MRYWMFAAGLGLLLAACSGDEDASNAPAARSTGAVVAPAAPASDAAHAAVTDPTILNPEGLWDLRIGQPVPSGSSWYAGEGQISDECVIFTSKDHPNAYAMGDGKVIRRITVSEGSAAKTEKGISVGASDAEVRRAYPGITPEPHKYLDAPARYLTWIPEADGPGLRFEIDEDGKVNLIHAGVMPWLGYVEGCA